MFVTANMALVKDGSGEGPEQRLLGAFSHAWLGGDARLSGMEQLWGCPEHRDGMFLLLRPVHLSSAVGTAGLQPVAAAWEGSSHLFVERPLGRISLSSFPISP